MGAVRIMKTLEAVGEEHWNCGNIRIPKVKEPIRKVNELVPKRS